MPINVSVMADKKGIAIKLLNTFLKAYFYLSIVK